MILSLSNVSKSFGSHKVLDNVNLDVSSGEVIGLVGKNGAGKTTLMNLLLGFFKLDNGEIMVNNQFVKFGGQQTNRDIGYLPDVPQFYSYMTSTQYLSYCGELFGMSKSEIDMRTHEVLTLVGLEKDKKKIRGYSRGMKQRLGMAQAIFHSPKLLICDEPMSALDPIGRQAMIYILEEIKKTTTIIFSSHVLEDVERLSSRIILLNDGSLKNFSPSKMSSKQWKIEFDQLIDVDEWFSDCKVISKVKNTYLVQVKEENIFQHHFYQTCLVKDIYPIKMEKYYETLDELFLEVVK
ncbi:ABC transporter ATP-binding protein [Vagococcus sp. JNUCC 83]